MILESNVYWKGMNRSILEKAMSSGYILPAQIRKLDFEEFGVYVSKSEKVAGEYGDVVLKLDLEGKKVVKSPHSNQFICSSPIEISRIIEVKKSINMNINNDNNVNRDYNTYEEQVKRRNAKDKFDGQQSMLGDYDE